MAIEIVKEPTTDKVNSVIDQLAAFPTTELPFVSLYLNAQANEHGRDEWETFLRKRLKEQLETFTPHTPEHESFERDVARIKRYLAEDLEPSANGVAIFACAAENDFFLALQVEAPIDENLLVVDHVPHIYPLLKLADSHALYAVLLTDTNSARLFTIGLGQVQTEAKIENEKVKQHQKGGWSQMRFQRHVENFHLKHAKEAVEALEKLVQRERVEHIILAGDEVSMPLVKEQLPKHLTELLVDVLAMDIRTPEHEVIEQTLVAFTKHRDEESREAAQRLIDEYRSQGLGVVGIKETLAALNQGKIDELIIHQDYEIPEMGFVCQSCGILEGGPAVAKCPYCHSEETQATNLREELLGRAREGDASVVFVAHNDSLKNAGGIGALLRFKG